MQDIGLASSLNITTLLLVFAIACVGAWLFFRKKRNQNPLGDKGLEANHPVEGFRDHSKRQGPDAR